MTISDRMLTDEEKQEIIDLRDAVKNIPPGPASGWTAAEANNVRRLLLLLADGDAND